MKAARHDPIREYLEIDGAVAAALAKNAAVVALESSVVAAGLPYPENLEAARASEAAVRAEGACPATIGLIDGRIKIGLSPAEIEMFARSDDVAKASRRDIPYLLATKQHGATTVAATLIAARLAGIAIFATGGIGGVHRGWQDTMDVSADLEELAETNVAVVCAGAKAILDLPATLEYLETRGVPVVAVGQGEMPGFYARSLGVPAPDSVPDVDAAAELVDAHLSLGLGGAVLICVPVPESDALPADVTREAIARAIAEAAAARVEGPAVTPWLLARIAELTEGASVRANTALIVNNARFAGELARRLAT